VTTHKTFPKKSFFKPKKMPIFALDMIDFNKANEVQLVDIFADRGVKCQRKTGKYRYFPAVWRGEKNASIAVDVEQNVWQDFGGSGFEKGGDPIRLIEVWDHKKAFDAAQYLLSHKFVNKTEKSSSQIELKFNDSTERKYIGDYPIDNIQLEYLVNVRKIRTETAQRYTRKVFYQLGTKKVFAVGFRNDHGGWELRTNKFKITLGEKWYTTIPGRNKQDSLIVFEGFMDFMSALDLHQADFFEADCVVLNSLSMLDKLDLSKYAKVWLALDNDQAGEDATRIVMGKYAHVKDLRGDFAGYKDYNEKLIALTNH
jgi:5S rRNA maturation endonuclease (ribonuclease M5)